MKELSIEKQIYLCKYHDIDKYICISMNMPIEQINELIEKYKQNGLYEQYRNISDEAAEKLINKEKLTKKYQTQDKYKKEKKILDTYNFDKEKVGYKHFLELLKEVGKNTKKQEDIILAKIYKKIAEARNIESYNVQNECQRVLNKAYKNNKELFKEYKEKPSIREFISKEVGKKIKNEIVIDNNDNVVKFKKSSDGVQVKNIRNDEIKERYIKEEKNDNILVQVPITMILELKYLKRIYRWNEKI